MDRRKEPQQELRPSLVWGLRVGAVVFSFLIALSVLSTIWPGEYSMAIDEQPIPIFLLQILVPPLYLAILTVAVVEIWGLALRLLRLLLGS